MNFFNRSKGITNEIQALEKDVKDAEMNNKILTLLRNEILLFILLRWCMASTL